MASHPSAPPLQRGIVAAVRVVIAVVAFTGFGHATLPGGISPLDLAYWSQISALAVGLVASAGAVLAVADRDRTVWLASLRGASTSWTLVTLVVFAFLLGGDYSSPASALEHLAVPLLATAEWLCLGPRARLRWWWPWAWLVVPLAYLPVYIAASATTGPLYSFLRPGEPDFGFWILVLLVGFLGLGHLVWLRAALGVALSLRRSGRQAVSGALGEGKLEPGAEGTFTTDGDVEQGRPVARGR